MVDLHKELIGTFFIEFVGDPKPRKITISSMVLTGEPRPLYLVGDDGTKYNWSTIIRIKRT